MADRSVRVVLSAQIADFQAKMGQAASAADGFAKKLDANRASADVLANGLLTIGTVAAVGLGFAVKASADFEQAMSNVKATGQDAAGNFDALREAAVQMGAQTAFSATEAASGIENLMKAGVSAEDVLGGGLSGALDLAAAGSMQVGSAAEIAATALTQFGLAGADVPHVADLLAAAAGKAQGEVSDMGQALGQAGLVANQFGLSIEETVGGLAAFASAGLIGSDAGTSLKTMLQRLAAPSKEAAGLMSDLGISAYDASGQFVGLEGLAGQLQASLSKLTPAQRDAAMATIFGADAVRAANVLYKQGADGIADWTAKVNDQGFAAETAATKLDNLKGDLEALGGAFESVLIDGGSGANQALRGLVQGATDAVNVIGSLPAPVLQVGAALTGLVAVGGLAAGGLLKAYTTARDLHTAFRDLVPAGSALEGKFRAIAGGAAAAAAGLAVMGAATAQIQSNIERSLPPLGDIELALAKIGSGSSNVSQLDANFAGLEGRAGTLSQALQFMAARTGDNVSAFTKVRDAVDGLASGLLMAKSDVQGAEEAFSRLDAALVSMDPGQSAAAFAQIKAEAAAAGVPVEVLASLFPQYAKSLQESANASGGAVTAAEAVAGATGEVAVSAEDAAAALAGLASAMLGLSGSEMALEAAFDAATDAIAENGKTAIDNGAALDINTEAGRANKEALDAIASASLMLTQSQMEAGASSDEMAAAQSRARDQFLAAAGQMGLNSSAALELAADYGLIPRDVVTMVSAPGADISIEQAVDFKAKLDALPPTTRAEILSIFEASGYNAANAALDAIDGKTATTYIRTVYTTSGAPQTSRTNAQAAVADGGLFGPGLVQAYRSGGIHAPAIGAQQPQIRAAGGRGVLWAEDGAGPWEGFVSGHPAKRGRSRVITEEIARRLGGDVAWRFADGGVMGGGGAGGAQLGARGAGVTPAAIREALDGLGVRITGASVLADEVMGRLELSIARRR